MVDRIYHYLSQSPDLALKYGEKSDKLILEGYSDASFANSYGSKSISGYCFLLSGSLVSWYAHTQPVVALSTAEAEYMALTDAAKEANLVKTIVKRTGTPSRHCNHQRGQPSYNQNLPQSSGS